MGIRFLTPEQMLKAINFMERNLGRRRGEIDFEELGFGNLRKTVLRALEKYYFFSQIPINEVLGESPWNSSAQLRKEVFSLVNKNYDGFVSIADYRVFLKMLEKRYGIPKERIERALWLDWEENFILKKTTSFAPEEIVKDLLKYYNYLSLFRLLRKAVKMFILFEKTMSAEFIKKIYWLCKRFWMLCDFPSRTKCEIYPPEEMLPRNYGFILSRILRVVVRYQLSKVILQVGMRRIPLERDTILRCLRVCPREEEELTFDSIPEEKFYYLFGKERKRWKLVREPFPIIREDLIFVPDFLLERGKRRFYLEIVGYWRQEYRRAKREKLKKLRELPIIILVDEKFKSEFWDLGFPTFAYERNRFPIGQIAQFLSRYEVEELEAKKQRILGEREKILEKILGDLEQKVVCLEKLSKILGCFEEEIPEIMRDCRIRHENFVFLDGIGILSKTFYDSLLKEDFSGELETVMKKLEGMKLPLRILEELGYKIQWKSLKQGMVKKLENI